ncbi:hypothetical protein BDV95DRAFT_504241 [Massariosphaeria phaeospora]|uniref:Uncharacterized protein n=1 Tax=Massariosphaeria phaeospora TaxID=100035 RepID=A0A7C8M110_9PLEO|nr:hypothetical protein BDV95DRAFT_504241 [Massariosphaeria phaeospora]
MANTTNTQFHSWKPEPLVRGTFSILSSCLITMTLCVWTAVHLNLPTHKKESEQTWRKIKWLITALLAPEMVALIAYSNHRSNTYYRSDHDDPEEANLNHPPRYPWTLTHSFYAVMGGFALDTRGIPNFLPGNRQRVVVKGEGVHYLASRMPHLIPDMSKASIKDKSKANSLTKTIVCIQAAWFCVQTFSRWSQRLSVSLLELNTLAHAICSLLIYFLWWDKPLDVEEPLLIQGEDIQGTVLGGKMIPKLHSISMRSTYDAGNLPGSFSTIPFQGHQSMITNSNLNDSFVIECGTCPAEVNSLPGMFYGGIHLTAWTRTFRTDTQSLLWKLSGIGIASTGLILHLCWAVHLGFQDMRTRLRGSDESSDAVGYIFVFFAILLSLFYLFCRTYIIVASFMDITHLPDSAFEVPRWSQYFPHVG